MRKLLRFLLLVMLMSLPLRGMAAMLMLGQMPCHPVMTQMSHEHGRHHDQQHKSPQQEHGKCSVCGACCTSALADTMSIGLYAHVQASQLIAFVAHPYTGFLPGYPDRPPKA